MEKNTIKYCAIENTERQYQTQLTILKCRILKSVKIIPAYFTLS